MQERFGEMADFRAGQGRHNMSLQHIMLEIKQVLKVDDGLCHKDRGCQKDRNQLERAVGQISDKLRTKVQQKP